MAENETPTEAEAPEAKKLPTVEAMGETFTLNAELSEVALMEFAAASDAGEDGETMQGLASIWRFVTDAIADDDRARFIAVARKKKAKAADLWPVIAAVFGLATDRPTVRPSDSSDGPVVTAPSSVPSADVKVSGRFDGRPDLRKQLRLADEAEAQAS